LHRILAEESHASSELSGSDQNVHVSLQKEFSDEAELRQTKQTDEEPDVRKQIRLFCLVVISNKTQKQNEVCCNNSIHFSPFSSPLSGFFLG
jgi:hypothetical protein